MKNKSFKPSRVKQAIANFLGLGSEYDSAWAKLFGKTSDAGVKVTADKAMTLSAVYRCVAIMSQTIATMPLGFYERTPTGRMPADTKVAVASVVLVKPNADVDALMFWQQIIATAILHGNGFAEKQRIGGRIVALRFLWSHRLSWTRLLDGSYRFSYNEENGTVTAISEADIFHISGFSLGGKFGMSTIQYGVEVLGGAMATNTAANSTFKNGLMPSTFFKMDRILTPVQRTEFRENLEGLRGAVNAGKSPLLEGGMDIGQVGLKPDDAQLLESRVFSLEEVCRWFGVPPQLIGGGDKASSWASSSEQINIWFLQYSLTFWIKRVEIAIRTQLMTPTESLKYYAEYSVEGLLRADTSARKEFYATALQNGWMNRNEVRRLENLPPIEGGDVYTVQSNLLPVGKLGQQTRPEAAVKTLAEVIATILEKNHEA